MPPFDFPASPTLGQVYNGYTWDGEKWVLSAPLYAANYKKNYIINGAMQVSQENGNTAGPFIGGTYYPVDQFSCTGSNTTGIATAAQVAGGTPGGSVYRLRATVTAADASVGANDNVQIIQAIEGMRVIDLLSGSASAKTVTLRFGVKAPAGTYCVSFLNNAANRFYVAEYIIAAGEANIDVVKTITIALDKTGTWDFTNLKGLDIRWWLMGGSTFVTATPNVWSGTAAYVTANQFNFMGTNGNVFELFDVGLYEGTTAPPFVVPDYASELVLCQRYFESIPLLNTAYCIIGMGQATGAGTAQVAIPFKAIKRAAPTILLSSAGDFVLGGPSAGTTIACTSITSTNTDAGGAGLSLAVASGLTAGNATMLFRNNVSAAKMGFTARM